MALCAAGLGLAGCDRGPATEGSTQPALAPSRAGSPAPIHGDQGPALRFVAGTATHAGTVPEGILRGLSTDARVLDCPEGVVDGRSAFDADWVVAHPLDLDGDGGDDWLVEGRHPCLSGSNGADWWVYAGDAAGERLVAAAGRAVAVELSPATHGGFRDLRLEADPDVRLRYDAGAYAPVGPASD